MVGRGVGEEVGRVVGGEEGWSCPEVPTGCKVMAVESRTALGKNFVKGKPKKTRQGDGNNSKSRHNKKKVSRPRKVMDRHTHENWKKIKELMEREGRTETFFYKRAVAILAGRPDPLK